MNKSYYELMIKLTDEANMNNAIRMVNSNIVIPGFRKGKAPRNRIIDESYTKPGIQKRLVIAIMATYFPNEKVSDETLKSMSVTDATIAGNMAAYMFCQKETEFPLSLEEIQAILDKRKDSAQGIQNVHLASEEIQPSEQTQSYVDAAAANEDKQRNNDGAIHKAEKVTSKMSEQTDQMGDIEKIKRRGDSQVKYFGYIQVVPKLYMTFYNFHPIAEINKDENIIEIDSLERNERFPTYGNINIYTSKRNDDRMKQLFHQGVVYVFDIDSSWLKENYRSDGELNKTNWKLDLSVLDEHHAIHKPNECGLYAIVDYQGLTEALKVGDIIRLPQGFTGDYEGEGIVLCEKGELVGPFPAMCDQTDGSWYVNPQLRKNNFVLTAYEDKTELHVSLPSIEGGYGDRWFVNLQKLRSHTVDYISDTELITEFNKVLESMKSTEPDSIVVINSAFTDYNLPQNIAEGRRKALQRIFTQYTNLETTIDEIQKSVNALLVNASRKEKDVFDQTFAELAKDNDFMLSIQRYHIISDAIDEKNDELKKQTQELERLQKKTDETRQELVTEKAAVLTEEIQEKQAELDRINAKLKKIGEKLDLATDIDKLQIKLGVNQELLKNSEKDLETSKEKQVKVQNQTAKILDAFKAQVQEPLNAISQYVLQDEVAAIITRAMRKSDAQTGEKRLDEQAKRYLTLPVQHMHDAAELVSMLCDRVKSYRNYSRNEIINILICITQGFLTVFSGDPGTGKTSMCDIIAHAIGVDATYTVNGEALNPRYAVIPVERGWSSKRDFIGYYNPLTKTFDKNNSSIYTALETTTAEFDKLKIDDMKSIPPYFVLLDEANLSPMEYYWADFMRACDMPKKPTEIQLSEHTCFKISNSLRFMATINNDHTTESLSPRLIDRAWVISLPQPADPKELEFKEEKYSPISLEQLETVFGVKAESGSLAPIAESIMKSVLEFCKEKLGVSISPRSNLAMKNYCLAGSLLFEDSDDGIPASVKAVDYAVAQKVLPKLQGSGSLYKKALEELHPLLLKHNMLRSAAILKNILQNGERNMQYYQYFA